MDLLQSYGEKSDEEGGEESRREGEEKGKGGAKVEADVAPASPDSDSSSSPPRILQAKSAAPRVDDTALGVEVGRVGAGGEEVLGSWRSLRQRPPGRGAPPIPSPFFAAAGEGSWRWRVGGGEGLRRGEGEEAVKDGEEGEGQSDTRSGSIN